MGRLIPSINRTRQKRHVSGNNHGRCPSRSGTQAFAWHYFIELPTNMESPILIGWIFYLFERKSRLTLVELTNLITQLHDEVGAANKRILDFERIDAGGSRPKRMIDGEDAALGYGRLLLRVMPTPRQRSRQPPKNTSKCNLVMWPR